MGIGSWDERTFDWRSICHNVHHLRPKTVKEIATLIADVGHVLVPEAINE